MPMEKWQKVVLLTTIYFTYLIVGTLIFQALERGEEENLRMRVRTNLETFLVNNTCVDTVELRMLVNHVVNAYSNGLRFEESNVTSFGKHLWDFSNSLFFATTVITTIGYGNMTPSTPEGKTFCMLFALVGIPLTGIFASLMGNQLESHWTDVINRLNKSLLCIKSIKLRKLLVTLSVALGLYFIIVCVPAFFINEMEGWGWFISHYYALISISTIGFGDYVAGNGSTMSDTARAFYKLALVIYFVFGFVILTIIFKMSQQIHDRQVKKVRRFTNSVKGRLRRASMFPSQSSTKSTPRQGSVTSRNGDAHRGSQNHKHTQRGRRKSSPSYPANGHIKRPFNFARTRKNSFSGKTSSKKPPEPFLQQEVVLNVSTNSISYISKERSTVVDGDETLSAWSVSNLQGSKDEVFTLLYSHDTPSQETVRDYTIQNTRLKRNSRSFHDLSERRDVPVPARVRRNTSTGVGSDGCRTL
ncbi:potassium channel, subfamily K, member 16-like [Amphiura filiformis]|uniref:potassium channel, subfamily K, member 16-like n=1 Tax=Amphiura filiformis TaxID=82378 RepID=UPI003B225CB7